MCNTSLDDTSVKEIKSFTETSLLGVINLLKFRINAPVQELSSFTMQNQKWKNKALKEWHKQSCQETVAPGPEN